MRILDLSTDAIAQDDVYSFTYPSRPGRYEGVEERFPGVPLLVVDAAMRVVCGHDYLLLLRSRGRDRVPALQADLPPADCLLLNANILDRLFGLNLYERLLLAGKLSPLLPRAEIQRRAGLGFPIGDRLLERLPLLLDEPFRSCLAAGRLGLKTALKLAGQPEADRLAQLELFLACGFSESEQWRLAHLLEEIAFREKTSLAAALAGCVPPTLLAGEMPQKRVLEAVHERRHPALSRREGEWRAWRRRQEAQGGVELAHAPLFASDQVRLTWTVKDLAAAEKLLRRLKKESER